jgi:hypothetical protein
MPAIQLARLKLQAGLLRDSFSRPQAFVRQIHYLLEFYANRSHRRGQSGDPAPLIHSYNVPAPVLRQIILEVTPLVQENFEQALELIDCLWKEENLECRTIAISLLGILPVAQPNEILDRVHSWIPVPEERLVEQILSKGLARLRQEARPHFVNTVNLWIKSSDKRKQQIGLRSLVYPLAEGEFEDLPTLFRILTPVVRNITPFIKQDLVFVFQGLARSSPNETAYFLRQNMPFPDIPWLTRQVIKELPEALQGNLKKALKQPLSPL